MRNTHGILYCLAVYNNKYIENANYTYMVLLMLLSIL